MYITGEDSTACLKMTEVVKSNFAINSIMVEAMDPTTGGVLCLHFTCDEVSKMVGTVAYLRRHGHVTGQ